MNGDYLLDTNVVSAWFRDDAPIAEKLREGPSILLPSIVAGELLFGAQRVQGKKQKQLWDFLGEVFNSTPIVSVDLETAEVYAVIKHALERQGTPIPENDVWIAAIARQHGLILVSRDAHFGYVEQLKLEKW
jgi:tRNA(fMet)-specific endonuclease VapC